MTTLTKKNISGFNKLTKAISSESTKLSKQSVATQKIVDSLNTQIEKLEAADTKASLVKGLRTQAAKVEKLVATIEAHAEKFEETAQQFLADIEALGEDAPKGKKAKGEPKGKAAKGKAAKGETKEKTAKGKKAKAEPKGKKAKAETKVAKGKKAKAETKEKAAKGKKSKAETKAKVAKGKKAKVSKVKKAKGKKSKASTGDYGFEE